MKSQNYLLNNLTDTKKLATILSTMAQPNLILLLNGPLGSGKTQLAKLIGQELGVIEPIISPTFIIWNQYHTKYSWNLIHMDAYRLNNNSNNNAEYYEIMTNNFIIIEWPDMLSINFNHYCYIAISLDFNDDNNSRKISITTNNLSPENEKSFRHALAFLK